jgi:protein translocase subunit secA
MNDGIKEESVRFLFNFELPSEREEREASLIDEEAAAAEAVSTEAEQRQIAARMANDDAGGRVDAEKVLGIKPPKRSSRSVAYSSSAKDGSDGVQTTDSAGRAVRRAPKHGGAGHGGRHGGGAHSGGNAGGMNRAQRRAASRKKR